MPAARNHFSKKRKRIHIVLSETSLSLIQRNHTDKANKAIRTAEASSSSSQRQQQHESNSYFDCDEDDLSEQQQQQQQYPSSLHFFAETHEDQEAPYQHFLQSKKQRLLELEISSLATWKQKSQHQIQSLLYSFQEKEKVALYLKVKAFQEQQHADDSKLLLERLVKELKRKSHEKQARFKQMYLMRLEYRMKWKCNLALKRILQVGRRTLDTQQQQEQPEHQKEEAEYFRKQLWNAVNQKSISSSSSSSTTTTTIHAAATSSGRKARDADDSQEDVETENEETRPLSNALVRYTLRKQVWTSQMETQLYVDLFHEGLFVCSNSSSSSNSTSSKEQEDKTQFFPWSSCETWNFLYTLMCGQQVPTTSFYMGQQQEEDGIYMKCTISDYRRLYDSVGGGGTTNASMITSPISFLHPPLSMIPTMSKSDLVETLIQRIQTLCKQQREWSPPLKKYSFLIKSHPSITTTPLSSSSATKLGVEDMTRQLRREQLFLLSMYPVWNHGKTRPRPNVLSSSLSKSVAVSPMEDDWYEPGSQLILDPHYTTTGEVVNGMNHLPRVTNGSCVGILLSEMSSSSGRQLSSFMSPRHVRHLNLSLYNKGNHLM